MSYLQITSPEAIRRHALAADLPVDEIIAVVVRSSVSSDPAFGTGYDKARTTKRVI